MARPLGSVLLSFVLLALVYNVSQPLWEAPDEPAHIEFVRFIQQHRTLPVGRPDWPAIMAPWASGSEFSQVPLYYLVLAVALAPLAVPPTDDWHPNPYVSWPGHPLRRAVALHRLDEGWPYRGLALFVHAGRALSLLLVLLALWATHRLLLTLTDRPGAALFGTIWLAWNPGVILAAARVNNDAGAMALSALTMLLSTRLLLGRTRPTVRTLGGLALALAGALLSKLHTLVLGPLVGLAVLLAPGWPTTVRPWRRGATAALVLAGPLGLLGLWWLGWGRTFGPRVGAAAGVGALDPLDLLSSLDLGRLAGALWTLHGTWWGGVGFGAETLWPPGVYLALAGPFGGLLALGLAALVGGRADLRPAARRTGGLLALVGAPLVYGLVARNVVPGVDLDPNARLLLPLAPVLALLVTLGGLALPAGWRRPLALVYSAGLLALAVATPLVIFPQISAPVVPARLPATPAERTGPAVAEVAPGVDLLRAEVQPTVLQPDAPLHIQLVWRVRERPTADFTVFLHLVGAEGQRLTGADAVPLETVFPPRLWQPGELVEEERRLSPPAELPPGFYALRLGAYRWQEGRPLPLALRQGDGTVATLTLATWRVLPPVTAADLQPAVEARFGEALILRAYQVRREAGTLRVSLFWQAERPIERPLTVSVQILDEEERLLSQHDGPPVEGRLPTPVWAPGEIVRDDHWLPFPPAADDLRLIVVVYDAETHQRLPVSQPGESVADHLVLTEDLPG